MKRMTKREIIEDTVEYFSKHPRALRGSDGMCVYYDPETEARCAVGRFSASRDLDIVEGSVVDVYGEDEEIFDSLLKPEVQGHSIYFWEDLQLLHDRANHWCESGLSGLGQKYKEELLSKYGEEQRS